MTTSDAGTVILQVEGLSHSYGGLQAVTNVSFAIRRGTFCGLIGPNGAGKSTLLDCISGRVHGYKGRISFNGADITGWPLHRTAAAGLVRTFQVSRIFQRLSVISDVMVGAPGQVGERVIPALLGTWKADQKRHLDNAVRLLRRFQIADVANNLGSALSGGQQRLVELSRTMMARPAMLLLDEPFAGVSPVARRELVAHLKSLCEGDGVTILMIEHRLDLIEELCDPIHAMAQGELVASGNMTDLRKNDRLISAYLGHVKRPANGMQT